jgi:hypothetical protein
MKTFFLCAVLPFLGVIVVLFVILLALADPNQYRGEFHD